MGNILSAPFVYITVVYLGLTKLTIASVTLATFGTALRLFMRENFFFAIASQFFLGTGACFLVNTNL